MCVLWVTWQDPIHQLQRGSDAPTSALPTEGGRGAHPQPPSRLSAQAHSVSVVLLLLQGTKSFACSLDSATLLPQMPGTRASRLRPTQSGLRFALGLGMIPLGCGPQAKPPNAFHLNFL